MAAQLATLRIFFFVMLVAIASGMAIEWPHRRVGSWFGSSASLPLDLRVAKLTNLPTPTRPRPTPTPTTFTLPPLPPTPPPRAPTRTRTRSNLPRATVPVH